MKKNGLCQIFECNCDSGCAYVTGFSQSIDFPTTAYSFDETNNGGREDVIVVN